MADSKKGDTDGGGNGSGGEGGRKRNNGGRVSGRGYSKADGGVSGSVKKAGGDDSSKNADATPWRLFVSFFKIGLFTFGGGYAMIPLIQREVIDRRGWVSPSKFLELLTLAQSAPGPISLNTAVFVGYTQNRYRGAVAAILGVVIPSFVVILLIAIFFSDIKDNRAVEAVFKGMRPAVVALIVAPIAGLTKGMGLYRVGLALLAAAAVWRLGVSPVWFIILGAAGGILWAVWRNKKQGGTTPGNEKPGAP